MQFKSNPLEEHSEVPLADEGRFEQLLERWRGRDPAASAAPIEGQTPAYLVCVGAWDEESLAQAHAQLAELVALVGAQGGQVLGSELCRRTRFDPRTYLGSGTAEAIAERARAAGATLLILDAELSPSQTRNLEDLTGLSVSDREAVILNVFLRHARTRKARIQVEIAQLEYLRPRIRGIGLDMDQQAGGLMNARGPGETASELLARQLDGRLIELRRHYTRLERSGERRRERRAGCERIALVGYTNAGKTSLMNALTAAELSARDMPFETLDTTTRCLTRHGGEVLLTDTVGFIRRLPARLLASFETTLAEIRESSLIALVVDLSDPEWEMHLETTAAVLARLDAAALPRLVVFNKLDRVAEPPHEERLEALCEGHPHLLVSCEDDVSVGALRAALIDTARRDHRRARLVFAYASSELISRAYARCRVLEAEALAEGLALTLEGPAHVVTALERANEEDQA